MKNKFERKILNKISPFTETSQVKGKEIRVFVGRENEKNTLMTAIQTVAISKHGSAIKITGPGGSGKSTLFGYIAQLIDNGNIFKQSRGLLDESNLELLAAFIDAPKDQDTSFRYFWTSIVDSFSDSIHGLTAEFFEYFATKLILTCLKRLISISDRDTIISIMQGPYPRFKEDIKDHNWEDLVRIDRLIESGSIYYNFDQNHAKQIIERNIRRLQRIVITLPDGTKRRFSYEKEYFDKLFDLFDDDAEKTINALLCLKGSKVKFLPTDKSIMKLLNWVCNTWEWIHKKSICIVVGVDNLGYLTANANTDNNTYNKFVQTLLQMRNDLNNFLFVIIGTNSDWDEVENFVKTKQDYKRQLSGFFSRKIDLNRLTKEEAVEALRGIMQNFWTQQKLSPTNIYYPFSAGFFSYLYDYEVRDYRSMLNVLNGIWNWFKEKKKVKTFDKPFDYIRFIRKKWAIREGKQYILQLRDLIPFEKKVLKDKWNKIDAVFKSNEKSNMVEVAMTAFIEVLRDNEVPRRIALVQQHATLQYFTKGKKQTRFPDVYVAVQNPGPLDENRAFEIQVKIHEPNQYVRLKEIEGSLGSLTHKKIDALVFLITGPGLEPRALTEIERLQVSERVFCVSPLNSDQLDALLLMVYYRELIESDPPPLLVKEIFSTIFGIDWEDLINRIGNMTAMSPLKEPIVEKEPVKQGSSAITDYLHVNKTPEVTQKTLNKEQPNQEEISVGHKPAQTTAMCKPENDTPASERPESISTSEESDVNEGLHVPEEIVELKNRYECILNEVSFILNLALDRKGRWGGQVTKDYVKKRVPPELKEEQCRLVFDQLRKDAKKFPVILAEYEGTSLKFNDTSKKFRKYLQNPNE
ncbi:MAG: hypothetical protein GF364_16645 [Candidatus Lokiarchaeota archaeon]|nr:hypothetical protein [Candidatus Lokiarchaeota archaeon]